MRLLLAALAGWALVQGPSPAFAFKNLAVCDIVSFASEAAKMAIAPEAWQSYRGAVLAILSGAPKDETTQASQEVAGALIEAQTALLLSLIHI